MKTVRITKTDGAGNKVAAESQVPGKADRAVEIRHLTGCSEAAAKKVVDAMDKTLA